MVLVACNLNDRIENECSSHSQQVPLLYTRIDEWTNDYRISREEEGGQKTGAWQNDLPLLIAQDCCSLRYTLQAKRSTFTSDNLGDEGLQRFTESISTAYTHTRTRSLWDANEQRRRHSLTYHSI